MKMTKLTQHTGTGYLIYILSDKNKRTVVGISLKERFSIVNLKEKFSKLVYVEKFFDRAKALRRKSHLNKLGDEKRLKLIKKKNPEMLNLIFTINDL
jgi:predicted GIY-YIG superfamily endonuclease